MGGSSSSCEPSESTCIEDSDLQSRLVQDTDNENDSEGIIKFVVTSAQEELCDQDVRLFSPIKYINSLPWKIMLQRKDSKLGIFLCLHGTEYDPNYKVFAEFAIKLVDQKKFSNSVLRTGKHEFRRGGTGHGFPDFTDVKKLLDPDENFLRENIVIIECHLACSSLLKVMDVNAAKDVAIQAFIKENDLSVDYLANRAKYILENGIGSDCEFIVDGLLDRRRVSKAILARASPVFERMFFIDGKGSDAYRVSDISSSVLDVVLQHIYGVKWEFQSKVQASELYFAACKYELKDLQLLCIQYMWPTQLDDAWIALDCAVRYKLDALQEAALILLRKNASEVLKTEEFLNVSLDCLILILKQTNLNITSESEVFDAVLRWANAVCTKKSLIRTGPNLRSALGEAIKHIRFLAMTVKQFSDSPCKSGVLTEKEVADIFQRLVSRTKEPLIRELSGITSPRQIQ